MSELPVGPPTASDLETCRRTLAALEGAPGLPDPANPKVAEVLRLAARLMRAAKKSRRQEARQRDEELRDASGIRNVPVPSPLPLALPVEEAPPAPLSRVRSCYICKQPYDRLHPFYDCLCPACGDVNFAKRQQTADLRGRTALVTGGRVKIGFQVVLKLLRAGATVIATTRFPHDAARRYAAQPDATDWADRLSIQGLDLRHLAAVERFAAAVAGAYPHLDVFIHNAAQTVRRPPAFYRHLVEGERGDPAALPPLARLMFDPPLLPRLPPPGGDERPDPTLPVPVSPGPTAAGWTWAELSQVPLLPGDDRLDPAAFPAGLLDADGQQVDHRPGNSWGLPLRDVTAVELLEVQAVNCLSPFLLLRGLDTLLRAEPRRDRYVVLVSAVEGQFGVRFKTGRHPHTNMAKAALNMITRTCAEAYAAERVFLTSVDTGWITNEAAHPVAERMRREGFRSPLDAEDGAARVLDPVFTGVSTGVNPYGVFLKDYRPVPW